MANYYTHFLPLPFNLGVAEVLPLWDYNESTNYPPSTHHPSPSITEEKHTNAKVAVNLTSEFHIFIPFKLPTSQSAYKCIGCKNKCIAFVCPLTDYIILTF